MAKRSPAFRIRWSKREQDWVCSWPEWHRRLSPTANFLLYNLREEPHQRVNGNMPIAIDGALLHPETLAELERRGIDTKRIRITLPLHPPPEEQD